MKCAHCLAEFHANRDLNYIGNDIDGQWAIEQYLCPNPECKKFNLYLVNGKYVQDQHGPRNWRPLVSPQGGHEIVSSKILIRPKAVSRDFVPKNVPDEIKNDYNEACLILIDSPKASAALSRRCLQTILRETTKVKKADLSKEIQEILDRGTLPSHLAESIDAIRNIGNFGTHPTKSTATNEIIDVEPGEAEWNLDVLEMMFDFYYNQPVIAQKRKDDLNAKLIASGKPPMK